MFKGLTPMVFPDGFSPICFFCAASQNEPNEPVSGLSIELFDNQAHREEKRAMVS